VGLTNLRETEGYFFKLTMVASSRSRPDHCNDRHTDRLEIQLGVKAPDYPCLFQLSHPLGNRRCAQADSLSELTKTDTGIILKLCEKHPSNVVNVHKTLISL